MLPHFLDVPRLKSVLSSLLCFPWSLAWSSVAVACAVAAACFNIVCARIEAGEEGAWNSVMTSLTPACGIVASEERSCRDFRGCYAWALRIFRVRWKQFVAST